MQRIKDQLNELKKAGQFRQIPLIEEKAKNKFVINRVEYINFASNDYLNLSTNLELRNEFLEQNNNLMSSASARLLSGSSREYNELEFTLANLFNKDACLVFNTGYQCNLGVISTLCELVQKGLLKIEDAAQHVNMPVEVFRSKMEQM